MPNCKIKGNEEYRGSLITSSCETVTLKNITIMESNTNGLFIFNSVVTADNLLIHHTKPNLLVMNKESFLTLTNSQLHLAENNAIQIADHSSIEISNCHFSDTLQSIIYGNHINCSIKNSTFENPKLDAIILSECNDFVIENNNFSNINSAIEILSNSCGTIDKNTFIDIGMNGIIASNSDILIKNNVFNRIKHPAIGITGKSAASIQFNKISKVDSNAISIRYANHAEIEN